MPERPKVLVAMSGGVDSSVAAALLVPPGYDVVGCFMRLGTPGEGLEEDSPAAACAPKANAETGRRVPLAIQHRGCCSVGDAADARSVAAQLGIPFYICNFKKDFGRIIDYFVDEYANGRTPNPCVRCNDWLKFGKLHDYARQIGADYVASGHYARIGEESVQNDDDGEEVLRGCQSPSGEPALLRGRDVGKDQSYVLFGVPRGHLSRMLLPVGHLPKSRVRALAFEFGLPVFDKPDSQEICFVPDDDYAGLVARQRPDLDRCGPVTDESGTLLGEHAGQHRFTIGQRRGLGAYSPVPGEPVFVIGRDARRNAVIVGPRSRLGARGIVAGEANWLAEPPSAGEWFDCLARIRSNSQPVAAKCRTAEPGDSPTPSGRRERFEVEFSEPQEAAAPGQAAVLYRGDRVIGGGWIERAIRE